MFQQGAGVPSYGLGTGDENVVRNVVSSTTSPFSPNTTRLPTYVPPPLPPPTGSASERVSSIPPAYLSKRLAPPLSNGFFGVGGTAPVGGEASFSSKPAASANTRAHSTFATHSSATLHTLTQLQQFFDSHQFDTAGPYADLFNVLLSCSKHVVDVGLLHHVTLTEYDKEQQRIELEVEALCDYSARCREELHRLAAAEGERESRSLQSASAAGQLEAKAHVQLTKEVDILRAVVEGMHRRLLQYEQETHALRTGKRGHRASESEEKGDESYSESSESGEDERERKSKRHRAVKGSAAKEEKKTQGTHERDGEKENGLNRNQEFNGVMNEILARLDGMQERMDKLQRGVEAHALFTEDELESVKRSHLELVKECKKSSEDVVVAAATAAVAAEEQEKEKGKENESSAKLRTIMERTTEERCAAVETNLQSLVSGLLRALQPGGRNAGENSSTSSPSRTSCESLSEFDEDEDNDDASSFSDRSSGADTRSDSDSNGAEEEEDEKEKKRPQSHRYGGRKATKGTSKEIHIKQKGTTKASNEDRDRKGKNSTSKSDKKKDMMVVEATRSSRNKRAYAKDHPDELLSSRSNSEGIKGRLKRTEKRVVSQQKSRSKQSATTKRHSIIDMKYFATQFRKLREMEEARMEAIESRFDDLERRIEMMEVYAPHSCAMAAKPPVLGVELRDCREEQGVRVERTFPGYAAERAGVRQGDVIVAVNGFMVSTRAEMYAVLSELAREKQYRSAFQRMHGQPAPTSSESMSGGEIVPTQPDGALDNAVLAVTSLDPHRFDIALHIKRGSKMSTVTVVAFSGNTGS